MKKKAKIIIIVGACILLLGSGTGITIHTVKKSANTTAINSEIANSEEITASSEADMENGVLTTIADNKNTADTSATGNSENTTEKANVSTNQVASDSKENTATNSTTGKSTGSSVTQTTSTSGNSSSRTTESNNTNTTEDKKNTADNTTESTEHVHNWKPVYTTVHYEAVYQELEDIVEPAWTEYETKWVVKCPKCGYEVDMDETGSYDEYGGYNSLDTDRPAGYAFYQHLDACGVGNWIFYEKVISETYHPEVTETVQWLVVPAHDEQVIDHYECECGAATTRVVQQ
ncbi:MAG: hypothetical protein J6K43_05385 [Lachnospiraceae bacterium]|nr:hypothetical protein [Lachnospiraceae bacterium]